MYLVDRHASCVLFLLFSILGFLDSVSMITEDETADESTLAEIEITRPPIDLTEYNDQKKRLTQNKKFTDINFSQVTPFDQEYEIVVWRRPSEMDRNAILIKKGMFYDVLQGSLGDCWLAASISSLIHINRKAAARLIENQFFDQGILYVQMKDYDGWRTVVIDDLLPMVIKNGAHNWYYMKSKNRAEYYPAMIEKAAAKLRGVKYQSLDGGFMTDAFWLLQGGVTQRVTIADVNEDTLFLMILKARALKTLIGAYGVEEEWHKLRPNHAYSVFGVDTIEYLNGTFIKMIKLRNPHGRAHENYNGPWGPSSEVWSNITKADQKRYRPVREKENLFGVFMMKLSDFRIQFGEIAFGHTSASNMYKVWKVQTQIAAVDGDSKEETFYKSPIYKGLWNDNSAIHLYSNCGDPKKGFSKCDQQYGVDLNYGEETNIFGIILLNQQWSIKKQIANSHIIIQVYKVQTLEKLDAEFFENNSPAKNIQLHNGFQIELHMKFIRGKYIVVVDNQNDGIRARSKYSTQFYFNTEFESKRLN